MIIRPFLYDLRRTITSKTLLILVGIILLISLTVIPLATIRSSGSVGLGQAPVLYYHDVGYHFLSYISNQYGDPISGVTLSVTLAGTSQNYTGSAVTDSSGLANVAIPNAPTGSYVATVKEVIGGGEAGLTSNLQDAGPGVVQSFGSSFNTRTISMVTDKYNASKREVQVFYVGAYGAVPTSYSLYYKPINSSGIQYYNKPYPFNESQMTFLGSLSDYHEIFDPSLPANLNPNGMVWFELFAQNKTAVSWNEFSPSELRQPRQPVVVSSIASFFFSGILAFFVPLMAIIGSYSSYGKDRLTGVLESVLARPVSRRGLAVSRFLSTVTAFSVAVVVSVGVVDLLLNSFGGSFLSQDYALAIAGGLIVEVAAFAGLIFLLSHLVKSTGALLGISIGLFVILDFFWSLIIFLLTSLLGATQGSAVSIQVTLLSYYANPAEFISLINTYVLQSASGVIIPSSSYGVTLPAIVLDGILWAVAPFILFLYLAVKRD